MRLNLNTRVGKEKQWTERNIPNVCYEIWLEGILLCLVYFSHNNSERILKCQKPSLLLKGVEIPFPNLLFTQC